MSGPSFIGQIIRRHPSNPSRWAGEDLLTDVTAAVINAVPGLARAAVEILAPDEVIDGEIRASTQVPPGERRRLDLVLEDEGRLRLWVEVKDWASESGDQLLTYSRMARDEAVIVYLVRAGAASASVQGVRTERWQEFAEGVRAWADADKELDAAQRWLVDDYLTYLKERGLVMSKPFPPDARETVARQWDLWETLNDLHTMVRDRLEHANWEAVPDRWAQRNGGPIDHWPGWWWSVFRARPDGDYSSCDFEVMLIGLTPEGEVDEPHFTAGLVWRSQSGPNPISDPGWIQTISGLQFDDAIRFQIAAEQSKLGRALPIVTIAGPSLADQADAMAAFADTTFGALRDHPPGASG